MPAGFPNPRPRRSNLAGNGYFPKPDYMADGPLWLLDNYADATPSDPAPDGTQYVQTVCGRCATMPTGYDLEFTWGSNNATKVTLNSTINNATLPQPDWCYIFQSIRLTRQKLIQPGLLQPTDYLISAPPPMASACCYFQSDNMGPTRQVGAAGLPPVTQPNAIVNMQWFLFYGNSIDAISGAIPVTPTDFDLGLLVPNAFPAFDSLVTGSGSFDGIDAPYNVPPPPNEDDEDDPPQITQQVQGWCLALVRRFVLINSQDFPLPPEFLALIKGFGIHLPSDPNSQAYVVYYPYALYGLTPYTRPAGVPIAIPVFNCRGTNTWDLRFNGIALPPHTIRTLPVGY